MLCKASPQNPARAGRQQRYADGACAVDYLDSSKFCEHLICAALVREKKISFFALYFPTQKFAKIFSKMSSLVTSPVISPSASSASSKS